MEKIIYEKLGVRTLINAAGTYTMVGGSRMSERTLKAMNEAARSHVVIKELQEKAHARLAEITRNEAAYVSNGAACGLHIAAAACVAKKHGRPFASLSPQQIAETEIVMFRAHRNPYDWALVRLGIRLVEVGFPNIILPATQQDLRLAITDKTAAVFFFAMPQDGWIAPGGLGLAATVEVAREAGVPVVVDGAAQVPPVENLWKITEAGADVCIFSGGKDLRGPQASGLVVGKKEILDWIKNTGFPTYGVGRMFKTGREEIVGLLSAVEEYVELDHSKRLEWCEEQVKIIQSALDDVPNVSVERTYPNEAGQPIPQALVRFKSSNADIVQIVKAKLMEDEPAIFTVNSFENGIYFNPMTLYGDEMVKIASRVREIAREI